jgi:hypothetical protein
MTTPRTIECALPTARRPSRRSSASLPKRMRAAQLTRRPGLYDTPRPGGPIGGADSDSTASLVVFARTHVLSKP